MKFVVENLLPQGLAILAGLPKYGKSWFVLDLRLRVSLGELFLNRNTAKSGSLYLSLEDSHRRLQKRIDKGLNGRQAPENLDLSVNLERLSGGLVVARSTRTKRDFAFLMQKILQERYKNIDKVILIADNLNTHNKAAFYETFSPNIAYNLAQMFEFHHTPVHGSWLNTAKCELNALARECLGKQRTNCIEALNEILMYWGQDRNACQKSVSRQFITLDARTKLKRLYPTPMFNED